MKFKKAQEEMIGFALIIILVAVILLAFLGFSLSKPQQDLINNYEVENFMQAFLQYTVTDCEDSGYLSVQDLIFECNLDETCSDTKSSCEVLNDTLKGILKETWPIGEDRPNKGYELNIDTTDNPILSISEGNKTNSYKGASQVLSKRRTDFNIVFKAYF